jgi:hypothetical protein
VIKIKELHLHVDLPSNFAHDLIEKLGQIMTTLDGLVAAVAEQTGKVDSMKVFILGLEDQIAKILAGTVIPPAVQAKLDEVFAGVSANTQSIVNAIDSNPETT